MSATQTQATFGIGDRVELSAPHPKAGACGRVVEINPGGLVCRVELDERPDRETWALTRAMRLIEKARRAPARKGSR